MAPPTNTLSGASYQALTWGDSSVVISDYFLGIFRRICSFRPRWENPCFGSRSLFSVTKTAILERDERFSFLRIFTDQTSKSNTEPGLAGGLADNGGPTQTIAIQKTGPAFNAIPVEVNGCGDGTKTDQRGVTRPQGKKCDVGAYEKKVRRH